MAIEEIMAVAISSFIPNQPINPKLQITVKSNGRLPRKPAENDLKISINKIAIANKAKINDLY